MKGHPSESVRLHIPFLKDARRFILRHGHTIQENPLQTYGAALVFSPVESIVRRSFWEIRNPGFRVIRHLEHRWGACLKDIADHSCITSISVSHDGQELAMAGLADDRNLPSIWIRNTGAGILLAQFNTDTALLALTWSCDGNSLLAITVFGEVVRLDRAIETTNTFGFSSYATTRGYDYAAICSSGIASVVRVSYDADFNANVIKSEVFTWDFTQRDQTFRTWEFPESTVSGIALSPDGSLLAMFVTAWSAGCDRDKVRVIEVNTGTCIQELTVRARSLAFSSDGCRLFIYPLDTNILALTVLTFPSGACEHLRLPRAFVADTMAISPDYTTIFTTCNHNFTSWDLEAFSSIVETPQQLNHRRLDDGCPIKDVAISPSGRFMISFNGDNQSLSLWRLPEATFERSLTVNLSRASYEWSFSQVSDTSKHNEAFILLEEDVAHIWFLEGINDTYITHPSGMTLPLGDLCRGSVSEYREAVSKLGYWHPKYAPRGTTPQHVNVSMTDGRMAAVSFKDTVEVSELGLTAKLYFEFKASGKYAISAIALSPSSTYLAISYGTTISIWALASPSTRHELRTNDKVKSIVFSPDESSLVYNTETSIWSCTMSENPKCLLQISGFAFPSRPCFSSSGQILTWLVHSLGQDKKRVYLWNTSRGLRLPTFEVSYQAHTISFSEDDQALYVLGRLDTLETYQFAQEISQLGSIGGAGLTCHKRIHVTPAWISCDVQKLLSIPKEYPICSLKFSSNFLALKVREQGFMILDFNW